MSIITLTDVGETMGVVFDPMSAAGKQAQRYINKVSRYVNQSCETSFDASVTTTMNVQADYMGEVDLRRSPITALTKVTTLTDTTTDLLTTTAWRCIRYDGVSELSGLWPHEIVQVTLTYGYATAPLEVQDAVTDIVVEALGGANADTVAALTVGDRTEEYKGMSALIETMGAEVLDGYRRTEYTMRLGPLEHPTRNNDDPFWAGWY